MTAARASVNKRAVPPREPVTSTPPAPAPIRSPGAQAAIDRVKAKGRERNRTTRIKVASSKAGAFELSFDLGTDRDAELVGVLDSCGTDSPAFAAGLLTRLGQVLGRQDGRPTEEAINWAFAALHGVAPRDETEAMLASMMAATHDAAMRAMNRLESASLMPSAEFQLNVATKMMRTHAALVATLKAYRTGGTQRVTVEHVTVNAGGQAIVGAVAAGGGPGARDESEGQPHAPTR